MVPCVSGHNRVDEGAKEGERGRDSDSNKVESQEHGESGRRILQEGVRRVPTEEDLKDRNPFCNGGVPSERTDDII